MAICKEDICHREKDFYFLLQNIEKKLLKLFEIKKSCQGIGKFKNKIFQAGNVGELSLTEIQFFLNSLQEILESSH